MLIEGTDWDLHIANRSLQVAVLHRLLLTMTRRRLAVRN